MRINGWRLDFVKSRHANLDCPVVADGSCSIPHGDVRSRALCSGDGGEAALRAVKTRTTDGEGLLLSAEPLFGGETAKTVRVRDGKVAITDGPFAETKEQLAGFYLVDAASDEQALQIAARIPPAREGSIEVSPVRELNV